VIVPVVARESGDPVAVGVAVGATSRVPLDVDAGFGGGT
jgi:hypothetical protein